MHNHPLFLSCKSNRALKRLIALVLICILIATNLYLTPDAHAAPKRELVTPSRESAVEQPSEQDPATESEEVAEPSAQSNDRAEKARRGTNNRSDIAEEYASELSEVAAPDALTEGIQYENICPLGTFTLL